MNNNLVARVFDTYSEEIDCHFGHDAETLENTVRNLWGAHSIARWFEIHDVKTNREILWDSIR